MKKKNLTKKQLKVLIEAIDDVDGELVGFINKIPVYSNPNVPEGVIYVINKETIFK